jgi:hypothetical protein
MARVLAWTLTFDPRVDCQARQMVCRIVWSCCGLRKIIQTLSSFSLPLCSITFPYKPSLKFPFLTISLDSKLGSGLGNSRKSLAKGNPSIPFL